MIGRKYIIVILVSVMFATTTLAAIAMLREESKIIGTMNRDNAWVVVKTYEEYSTASFALKLAAAHPTAENLKEVRKRLDIVWSRLDLLNRSPSTESIRQLQKFTLYSTTTQSLLEQLDQVTATTSTLTEASSRPVVDAFYENMLVLKLLTQDVMHDMLTLKSPVRIFLHNRLVMWAMFGSIICGLVLITILLLSMRDLSRASKQAEHSRLIAEKANRSKDEFLAGMSHELRTPLNAIIGFSDFALMTPFGPLNEKYQQYLRDIRGAGKTLLGIVDGLLNVARLSAGRVEPDPSEFSTLELAEECMHLLQPVADQRGILLELRHAFPDDHVIRTDRNFIYSILINLVTNAVKYSSEQATVKVELCTAPSGGLRLEVRDEGPGIPDDEKQRILEPFERLDSGQGEATDGFGLGLYLVRSYTESLSGTFQILNNPGGGTVARINLPNCDVSHGPAITGENRKKMPILP